MFCKQGYGPVGHILGQDCNLVSGLDAEPGHPVGQVQAFVTEIAVGVATGAVGI